MPMFHSFPVSDLCRIVMPPAINPATFLPLFMPAPEFGFSWIWNAWAPGGKPVKFGVTIMPWWLSFNAIVLISVPTPSAEILLTETVTSLVSAGVTPIKIAVSLLAMI